MIVIVSFSVGMSNNQFNRQGTLIISKNSSAVEQSSHAPWFPQTLVDWDERQVQDRCGGGGHALGRLLMQ
jgi:hypothetical protein